MNLLKVSTITALFLAQNACNPAPKIQSRKGGSSGLDLGRSKSNIEISISNAPELDAYEYTFGVSSVQLQTSGTATITRSALGVSESIGSQEEEILTELCSDITVGNSTENPIQGDSVEITSNEPLYVFWRSHYPASIKNALVPIIRDARIHCSLSLEIGGDVVDIVFNPVPVNVTGVAGTRKTADSIDEVLMLIDQLATGTQLESSNPYKVIKISEPGEIILGVEGLHTSDIQVSEDSSESTCRYHTLNGETKLGNPNELQSFSYGLAGGSNITIGEIFPSSSGSRSFEACNEVQSSAVDGGFNMEIPCEAYLKIQEQGQGDTCGWTAGIANQNDPKNSVAIGLRMAPLNLETIDVSTPLGASKAIQKSDKNPITLNTLDVSTFNDVQQSYLERAFDFWLGASPTSYASFWEGRMAKITYLASTDVCAEQGVLAFVTSLDTDEMFWCELAGMRPQDLTEQQSPLVLMLIAVTALHENLHAIGREHDFDAPNYEACKGTSESGVISYDTVVNCQEDACFAMKDLATQEYIIELDYSLAADGRRFQGQCQVWNAALGLNQGSFGT